MKSFREIYKKERITAEEIARATTTEQKKAIILGWKEEKRTYKEQEFGYITLIVECNKERRTIQLSQNNAEEIAKTCGDNPDNWLNHILLLHSTKDEKGFNRLGVNVWGRA